MYAGFWRRVGAYLIDYLVLLAAFVAVALVWTTNDASDDPRLGLVLLLTWLAYKVLMESSPYQATLGKLAIGIKVTDSLGNRISIARAVGRSFASFLSGLIVYIGFMMAGFTRRRQALHDMIAGTLVVKKELTPSAVANAGDAAPVSGWLIAALLLLGAVPMIGILAAIAIPAYQDYTIRSQVSEGLNLASAHKAAVAETWDAGQLGFPDIDSSAAGSEALARSGKYVESIEITSGVVTITYGFAAAEPLNGRTLALVPALDENQEIARVCGYGGIPAGYEVIFEDHLRFTDVPEKYLPGTCRGS